MVKCKYCGMEAGDAEFCPFCGEKLFFEDDAEENSESDDDDY